MRHSLTSIIVTAALFALCFAYAPSKSAAQAVPKSDAAAATETAPTAPPAATTPDSNEIANAAARFKEQDFDGALKLLQEAVKKNRDLPPAHVIMADFFAQANSPAQMRTALERAVIDNPDDPEAFVLMGDLAVGERRITEAEMLYQKAQSLIEKFIASARRKDLLSPRVFAGLAAANEARGNWIAAQKQLEAALKHDAKSLSYLQRLATCQFNQKNPQGALATLTQAAKMNPEVLTPEAILAQLYDQAGERENAKKWMSAALQKTPKDLRIRLLIGRRDFETGDLAGAKAQSDAALQIDPKSPDAQILRGVIALFEKDYTSAERYFEAVLMQSPRNFAASNNLALALAEQRDDGKKRRAVDFAVDNVQRFPKRAEAVSTYGWVMFQIGNFDEAEKALQTAASGGQVSPDTAYYIARLAMHRGNNAVAKQYLESAVQSPLPFAMRQESKILLEQLKK